MDIAAELEKRGAAVEVASSLRQALELVESDGLSAAILDHGLRDGDSSAICERLNERHIPFLIYSGYSDAKGACLNGPLLEKPARMEVLILTLEGLLKSRQTSRH